MSEGDRVPSLRLDFSDARPEDRIAQWRVQMAPIGDVEIPPESPPDAWSVRTEVWNLGGMLFAAGHYGAQRVTRSAQLVRAEQMDHYTLHVAEHGNGINMEADGRTVRVAAGVPILTDLAQPKVLQLDAGPVLSLFIPRPALDGLLAKAVDLHGVAPSGGSAGVLVAHLRSMANMLASMSREEAPNAMIATLHLLAASLAPSLDTLAMARPAIDTVLRRQIARYIDANLAAPTLNVDGIAQQFAISRATLYRLFEPLGGVANVIRVARLAHAHEMLRAPAERVYLARVADQHGFKSASHFSRAFRAQYGYSPSEVGSHDGQARSPAQAAQPVPADTSPAAWWRTVLA